MLPRLNFYGNHGIDFAKYDYEFLNYHIITVLRQLPIPDGLLSIAYESLVEKTPMRYLSKFYDIETWCPLGFPSIPGERIDFTELNRESKHITAMGQFGLSIIFTPSHIILPSYINERIDWYSPKYREKVQAHRIFYNTIIKQYLGTHALYVDERITTKYYEKIETNENALQTFEQILLEKYGTIKKSIYDFSHGQYPKYYIDKFTDIETQE